MDKKSSEPRQAPFLAKALAFILALLLVVGLPLFLLVFDVWRVVFNPPLIKNFITYEVVSSDLIPVGLEWFSDRRAQERVQKGEALTGIDEPDIVLLMSFLGREDWRAIKKELLTDEFLTHIVSVTVDGTYGWIDSADRVPQITWELTPLIDRLDSEHGVNGIVIAYDNLPLCTQKEIDDYLYRLSLVPPGVEVLYNLCQFPPPWHDDQFSDYKNALFKVVANVPPQFALTDELSRVADQGGIGPDALKGQLILIRTLGNLAWLLPLVLLLLIVAVIVRSLKTLSRWVGLPMLVGGLLALLPTLVYRWLIANVLAAGALSETPEIIKPEVIRVITRAADEIFRPMMLQAVVIMALALGLLLWYGLASRRAPSARPAAPAAG
ncbi:MAG: hypothetical protein HYY33_04830 [Chloroflexi bacterium]|nr:hypothetical protein [Chloroflexota bacterium]